MRAGAYEYALAAVIIMVVIVQYPGLDDSMWNDELSTWVRSTVGGPADIVQYSRTNDNHPPGGYMIYYAWIGLLGDAEVTLRLSSLVCHCLAILSLYALTRKLAGRDAALTAAGLLAFSPSAFDLGGMFRTYSPLVLMSVVLLWLSARLGARDGPRGAGSALAFVAVAILAEYTHYFGALMVFPACLYLVWRGLRLGRRGPLLAGIAPVAAYLPWLPSAMGQAGVNGYLAHKSAIEMIRDLFSITGYWTPVALFLWAAFAADSFVLAERVRRDGPGANRSMLLVLGWFCVPVLAAFAVSFLLVPVVTAKNLIVFLPAFILLAAMGMRRVAGRRGAFVLAVAVCASGMVRELTGNGPLLGPGDEQFEEAVRWVAAREGGRTGHPLLALAWNGRYFDYYLRRHLPGAGIDTAFTDLDGESLRALKRLVVQADSAYLLYGHLQPPGALADSLAPEVGLADSTALRRAGAMLLVEVGGLPEPEDGDAVGARPNRGSGS